MINSNNSDQFLQVLDSQRSNVSNHIADLPLISIAWRALKNLYQQQDVQKKRLEKLLLSIAYQNFCISKILDEFDNIPKDNEYNSIKDSFVDISDNIRFELDSFGVVIWAPVGETYTDEYMQVIENISQVKDSNITVPIIKEIVSPAILFNDNLLSMGKGIISVPA